MQIALKVLVGVIGLLLLWVGGQWLIIPENAAASIVLDLDVDELIAVNTMRGDMGGLLTGTALFCALGLITGSGAWLRSAAVLLLCVAGGRTLSLVVDGFVQAGLTAVIVEVVMAGILLVAARPAPATSL